MNKSQDIQKAVDHLYKNLQKILYFTGESKNIDFYISALTEYNPFYSTKEIELWLDSLNSENFFSVSQTSIANLDGWSFNNFTGDLEHKSGGFFSIRGLKVKTNVGLIPEWTQPIIYQPEIGILGIITKKINGILYFLMQAKAEPGNINAYQLSPTVQSTPSNYTRLHGGQKTSYIEYFLKPEKADILIDRLGSEQGARFYCKRNRNIIIRLRKDQRIELNPNYRWMTLGQIQALIKKDNIVNMDSRSVISEISFTPESRTSLNRINQSRLKKCLEGSPLITKPISDFGIKLVISSHANSPSLHTMDELLQKITQAKVKTIMERQLISLKEITKWIITAEEIFHEAKKYFSVIGVTVKTKDREVSAWDQPIIKQQDPGIVGFIVKEIDGVLHFLINLKVESGAMDLLEIAPTVQCITDNYSLDDMPPLTDKFLDSKGFRVIVDSYQSEEGGRFFRESNHSVVLLADDNFPDNENFPFMWVSLKQLKEFIQYGNFVNIEARSLVACLIMK